MSGAPSTRDTSRGFRRRGLRDTSRDFVWGCRDANGGYTGLKCLGRALMRVRDELRASTDPRRRS